MIITRTPYRVSLFGGGSDHPAWFRFNKGRVLSFSMNKFCYITTRILPPFFQHKYRIAYSRIETVEQFESIEHPAVREAIRMYSPRLNLEIHHDGDLPARSGIGSSSSFVVGIIHSLLALRGEAPSGLELARQAINLEQNILKENVGWQDQIACALGGMNVIDFSSDEAWTVKRKHLDPKYLQQFESRMVLIFTGIQRNSSDVSLGLLNNLDRKAMQMNKVVEMVEECEQIIDRQGDLDSIGEMLHRSWELKRELNPYSSNSEIDYWYERARKAGALGGKILGAGGGGFFLFWIERGKRDDFLGKLGEVNEIPIGISDQGSTIIFKDEIQLTRIEKI